MRSKLVLAVLVFFSLLPAIAQVKPAANVGGIPLGIGVGLMDYDIDYRNGARMLGVSVWGDYSLLRGLGLEIEGTAIDFAAPPHIYDFSQYTIKGGPIYKAHPILGIHPYAKALFGVTDANFIVHSVPGYTNDDFVTYSYGGGLEYRAWKNLFVRADYEYEFEHYYLSFRDLNPNGVTIGATYYLHAPRGYR
jgi:opacity protein-like surface antigen